MANTYTVETEYSALGGGNVELPEGKSWDDVEQWHVKWGVLHVQFKGEPAVIEIPLEEDVSHDGKRPTITKVYEADNGFLVAAHE